jgi:hypothetical protein
MWGLLVFARRGLVAQIQVCREGAARMCLCGKRALVCFGPSIRTRRFSVTDSLPALALRPAR